MAIDPVDVNGLWVPPPGRVCPDPALAAAMDAAAAALGRRLGPGGRPPAFTTRDFLDAGGSRLIPVPVADHVSHYPADAYAAARAALAAAGVPATTPAAWALGRRTGATPDA